MAAIQFEIFARSASSAARLGRVRTSHGSFDTPAFMPVGTAATVKGLLPTMVRQLGSQIILANTYHLMLRPGADLIARMGGLQQWTRWDGPMLTDSGGFQVFSLAQINKINDHGVTFRSHIDGATIDLTPEKSIDVQNQLGADVIMAFDDCPPAPGSIPPGTPGTPGSYEIASTQTTAQSQNAQVGPDYLKRVRQANERTVRWLGACVAAHARSTDQALFGIVQGGVDLDERTWCAQRVLEHDLPGYAIGGLAVGEGFEAFKTVTIHTAALLPDDRPRYLMGVGYERDLLTAVRAGVDMFDCVLPTRNGRNATAFTPAGRIKLRNAQYMADSRPLDPCCDCPACAGDPSHSAFSPPSPIQTGRTQIGKESLTSTFRPFGGFSRSYLRHLFMAREMLGPILVSAHNIRHFQRFMTDVRAAILSEDWPGLALRWPVLNDRLT